jgi:hypothetical protein
LLFSEEGFLFENLYDRAVLPFHASFLQLSKSGISYGPNAKPNISSAQSARPNFSDELLTKPNSSNIMRTKSNVNRTEQVKPSMVCTPDISCDLYAKPSISCVLPHKSNASLISESTVSTHRDKGRDEETGLPATDISRQRDIISPSEGPGTDISSLRDKSPAEQPRTGISSSELDVPRRGKRRVPVAIPANQDSEIFFRHSLSLIGGNLRA